MTNYTLTAKGRAWQNKKAPDPPKHVKVLASLSELILDNDVPRTVSQVSHNISIGEELAEQGLKYLTTLGYTKRARPPQPSKAPKIRTRPIEDLIAAELRNIEAQKKYTQSAKGKKIHSEYEISPLGKAKNRRYRESDKGKKAHRAYRLRRRLRELNAFLTEHPEQESEVRPYITEVEAKLTNLKED